MTTHLDISKLNIISTFSINNPNFSQMKTIFKIVTLLIFVSNVSQAQHLAIPAWTNGFGIQDTNLFTPMTTDNYGNVYVGGFSIDTISGADIAIVKYNSYGDTVYTASYTSAGSYRDQATCLALDTNYNLYVGGFSYVSSTNKYDYIVIKYDSVGSQQWVYTFNGTGSLNDGVTAIKTYNNDIYLTGTTTGTTTALDYTTIKLNPSGVLQWQNTYHYLFADIPFDIAIRDTSVFIIGGSQSSLTNWDYATLIYSVSGITIDTLRITGTGVGFDHASQVVTDALGYVYITGAVVNTGTGLDFKTIKLDLTGNIIWIKSFDYVGLDDIAKSIEVDINGNVYVGGQVKNANGNFDYFLIKYDSGGSELWTKIFDEGNDDKLSKITIDEYANVYITGSSSNGNNNDFSTVAYSTDGDSLFSIGYNGIFNGNDEATDIKVEKGVIYVTGNTEISIGVYEYKTIAYTSTKYVPTNDPNTFTASNSLLFEENKGQLIGTDRRKVPNVKFFAPLNHPPLFFSPDTVHFLFGQHDTITGNVDTTKRVDMRFIGGKAKFYPSGQADDYQNYYLAHCPKGINNVRSYQTLYTPTIYKGVSAEFKLSNMGLNIYITADKKINTDSLTFYFQGADSIYIDSVGSLRIASNGLEEYFLAPSIWQEDISGNLYFGASAEYEIIAANAIKISVYNINIELKTKIGMKKMQMSGCSGIPNEMNQGNIFHSTFYGQTTADIGYEDNNDYSTAMTIDNEGNIYTTGFTNSLAFPIYTSSNPGPFQSNFAGSKDGFIISFDNNMVRRWTTHIGGTGADSLICATYNPNDENIYFGGTSSSTNLPCDVYNSNLTNAYFDNSYNGNQDAVFGSCDKVGAMQLVTYIGGSGYDKAMGICVAGDVIMVTGNTKSTNITSSCTAPSSGAFPTCGTAGNFVKTANSGGQDIFLMKFEPNNSLSWSTLIGSSADDKVFDIEPYPVFRSSSTANFFYLCGETQKNSNSGPFNGSVLTNGDMPLKEIAGNSFFQSKAGGLILEFNNLGDMVWGTTVNGTKNIQTLTYANSSLYVAGLSNASNVVNTCVESSSGLSICNQSGEYTNTTGNLYIGRFNTGGELIYSTLYNSAIDIWNGYTFDLSLDKVIDMDANDNGDVFILAVGVSNPLSSNNFEPASPIWSGTYYQSTSIIGTYGDQYDCAIISFNSDNQRNWASFFGGGSYLNSGLGFDYPQFSEFPSAIACFENKDLFIAGYSGKECITFPLVDAGITPTGQAYFYDDIANSMETTGSVTAHADYDVFITKFDMASVNVGIKNNESKNVTYNKVYPSVTDNITNVYLSSKFSNRVTLTIIDIQGKEMYIQNVNLNNLDKTLTIDLSAFTNGIYLLRIQGEKANSESFKIIKK